MKSILTILCAFFILQTTQAQDKSTTKIAAAVEALRKNMVDPDKTALEALVSDDLSYGHSAGKLDTKASLIEALVGGSSDFVSINLTDQTIKISGNTAVVRHKLAAVTNDGGKPGEVKLWVLLVWQKQSKEWKLLARQAVKLP